MDEPEVRIIGGKIYADASRDDTTDATFFVPCMEYGLSSCIPHKLGVPQDSRADILRLLGKPTSSKNALFGFGTVHDYTFAVEQHRE
jgi:hypothetical protein